MIASNLLAVFLHWLDDAVAMEKGLILDFVGLSECLPGHFAAWYMIKTKRDEHQLTLSLVPRPVSIPLNTT